MEKLTKEEFEKLWCSGGTKGHFDLAWHRIEADREALRAEMREGLLKAIYQIQKIIDEKLVRRSPKKRERTKQEKREWLRERLKSDDFWYRLGNDGIDAICEYLGIPEVEE